MYLDREYFELDGDIASNDISMRWVFVSYDQMHEIFGIRHPRVRNLKPRCVTGRQRVDVLRP